MAVLTDNQIADVARAAGFTGNGLVMAVAIALAESEGNPTARHANASPPSIDRGLWQINDYWHKEVSTACADLPACAAQAVFRISQAGTAWGQWSTYTNGRYKLFLDRARKAAGTDASNAAPTERGTPPGCITLYSGPNYTGAKYRRCNDAHYVTVGAWFNHSGAFIRSIDQPANQTIWLYEKINYKGRRWVVTGPVDDTATIVGYVPSDPNRSYISSIVVNGQGEGANFPAPGTPQNGAGAGATGEPGDILGQIAAAETFDFSPQPDSTYHLDLGDYTIAGQNISIETDLPLPGSGYLKTLGRNVKPLAVRAVLIGIGLVCIGTAARNV